MMEEYDSQESSIDHDLSLKKEILSILENVTFKKV